ncbi:MAG: hypothetical protein ACFFBL_10420 [Promethearchaeota archaeon]
MRNQTVRTLSVMINLVLAVLITTPSSAQLVWQDDFEDGNLEGWTVIYSNFTVENGVLRLENDTYPSGEIFHSSTGVVGTWSFRIIGQIWEVDFIATARPGAYMNAYCLVKGVDRFGRAFYFKKILNDSVEQIARYGYNGNDSWNHVNITRNVVGAFEIYIDGELVINKADTSVLESSYFIYYALGNGSGIDDIEVVTELYTPPGYPTVFLLGFIATVAILVVAGFIYRKRIVVIED